MFRLAVRRILGTGFGKANGMTTPDYFLLLVRTMYNLDGAWHLQV